MQQNGGPSLSACDKICMVATQHARQGTASNHGKPGNQARQGSRQQRSKRSKAAQAIEAGQRAIKQSKPQARKANSKPVFRRAALVGLRSQQEKPRAAAAGGTSAGKVIAPRREKSVWVGFREERAVWRSQTPIGQQNGGPSLAVARSRAVWLPRTAAEIFARRGCHSAKKSPRPWAVTGLTPAAAQGQACRSPCGAASQPRSFCLSF